MTDDELIAHLRLQGLDKDIAAADRIEQLVQESIRRLDLARSEGVARVIQFERAETAEAKLAKAVGALREMLEDPEYWSPYARATLDRLEKTE